MNEISSPVRREIIGEIEALAERTGASPDEIEAAAREYVEHERWLAAEIQIALDEEAAGAPTFDAEEVFEELNARLEERIRANDGNLAHR